MHEPLEFQVLSVQAQLREDEDRPHHYAPGSILFNLNERNAVLHSVLLRLLSPHSAMLISVSVSLFDSGRGCSYKKSRALHFPPLRLILSDSSY